jgi:Cu/Zn superoxide dismutase
MRGTQKFGWLSAVAVAAGLALGVGPAAAASTFVQAAGSLRDLQPGTPNATDGASATFWAVQGGGESTHVLILRGLNPASVGTTFGAHVHVGPCVAGDGLAAGPHYNTGGAASPETEVWLDFTVRAGGYAVARTTVPFVIEPGTARSVVIHALPTAPSGAAGARQACLPVSF